jgi:hypothetical protein
MATNPNTTDNSFATILANFIRLQNNALTTLQQVQTATISNSETVQISVTGLDGTVQTYSIPSFGYLKSSIARIDTTIQKLMGFDGSDAFIRMPDGSFKKIYQAAYIKNPKPIGQVTVPTKFIAENNWFFESLYTPALKVSFDVTPYIPQQESKVYVKRMILNLDTDRKVAYYTDNLKGRNNLDYVSLMVDLQKNGINYFIDDEVIDLPLSIVRFSGDFVVVNSEDRTVTNPDNTTSIKRWYLLNKLTYTDNLSLTKDTQVLRPGDRMIKAESLYEVIEIDASTKFVRLRRLSGYDPIVVGESIEYYSETFSPKTVNVGIGFNESLVVFFRTVNDEENLISTIYSPGISFSTNDLNIDGETGQVTMQKFYQDNVLDFGNLLLSQAKENQISAVDGLTPDAPVVDSTNFSVVLVNDHKLDQATVQSIRKKQSDKVKLSSEIVELEKAIDKKKETLNSQKFNSDTERRAVKNDLDSLIRELGSKSSLYSSIVNELTAIGKDAPAALDSPKYRIRGFFGIPNPKLDPKTGSQSVIQFYTYYRYVRPDGSQSNVKQYEYTDQNGQVKRGTYSNLQMVKSEIRPKVYDVGTGKYVWVEENVEEADIININQVDIPISKGETVEFYIVSVSEAGWPLNPLLSEPSATVAIEFPTDLITEDEATVALQEASSESIIVRVETDLQAQGLYTHLSSSFNAAERYYAHNADVISSNFYTSEGNVISLYEKLKEYETRIATLEDRLNRVAGKIAVFIIDPDNNAKVAINTGDVIQLFSGYYRDYVDLLPANEQRGAIVNKTYQVAIQNSEATPLQLVSVFPGGIGGPLPTTLTSISTPPIPTFGVGSPYAAISSTLFAPSNDSDYNKFRKYDRTPIVQTSVGASDTNNANKYTTAYYQSGQTTGQFMFSRFTDIGLLNPLYIETPTLIDRKLVPTVPTTGTEPFIWRGTYTGTLPNGNGTVSAFCIHTDHPALNSGTAINLSGVNSFQTPDVTIDTTTGFPLANEAVSRFVHAFGVNSSVSSTGKWSPQLAYYQRFLANTTTATPYSPSSLNELPDKFGFIADDRYLIGEQTCGSYLFVGPSTFNQLNVDGTDARSKKEVETGDNNAILIPIIFQFRMEDYYGPAGGAGNGYVGGYNGTTVYPKQLQYSRRIGLDVYTQDESVFSFDIQVSAAYKKTSLSQVVATATPVINKELQNIVYNKNTIKTLTI